MTEWKDIHSDFTEELKNQWQNKGFTHQQCKEWISVGFKPADYRLVVYIRDILGYSREEVLDFGDLKKLREMHEEHLKDEKNSGNQGWGIILPFSLLEIRKVLQNILPQEGEKFLLEKRLDLEKYFVFNTKELTTEKITLTQAGQAVATASNGRIVNSSLSQDLTKLAIAHGWDEDYSKNAVMLSGERGRVDSRWESEKLDEKITNPEKQVYILFEKDNLKEVDYMGRVVAGYERSGVVQIKVKPCYVFKDKEGVLEFLKNGDSKLLGKRKRNLYYWWKEKKEITDQETERLVKIGISDKKDSSSEYRLRNLKQILFCETVAKESVKLKRESIGKIKEIAFFTPKFNKGRVDVSNYSCALITDNNNQDWVIVYRPSYVEEMTSDMLVKKVFDKKEAERKLNSDKPILAVAPSGKIKLKDIFTEPYVSTKVLPEEAKTNPDQYILPLDIAKRPIKDSSYYHYAIYLGDGFVVQLTGAKEGTVFDTWKEFYDPSENSSLSSTSGSGSGTITKYHLNIPFKARLDIVCNIATAIQNNYGKRKRSGMRGDKLDMLVDSDVYDFYFNNCEHFANSCVLGIKASSQAGFHSSFYSAARDKEFELEEEIENNKNKFSLRGDIEGITRKVNAMNNSFAKSEKNRKYIRELDKIRVEKFEAKIEVKPNPPCKIQ